MRRPSRPARALGAVLALAASSMAACAGTPPADSADTPGTVEPTTTTRPTTTLPGPLGDQTPPLSTFGMAFHAEQLWVADFYGNQIVAVDPDSGSIVRRLTSADGVSPEVNDVAVGANGTIYWIGFNDGAVAVLSNNAYRTIAPVTPGTYGIALSADGTKLYAGGAVGRPNSVWTVDLKTQQKEVPSPAQVAMRSFDVGADGKLYGPRFGSASAKAGTAGALIQVDPTTGVSTDLVGDLDGPIAVKLSADKLTAHVLSLPPGGKPSLATIDLATGERRRPPVELRTPLADNLAVADDGRVFVSSYNDSLISVVGTDASVKTLHIGQRPTPAR
jgi:hypothetical protein